MPTITWLIKCELNYYIEDNMIFIIVATLNLLNSFMVMSILQIIILVMVKCSLSLKVLHQLPQSEILGIVERSWIENDIPIENTGNI